MDEKEIIDLFRSITGIDYCTTNGAGWVFGTNKSGITIYLWYDKYHHINWYTWHGMLDTIHIQDVIDPELSDEAKLELVLRYG